MIAQSGIIFDSAWIKPKQNSQPRVTKRVMQYVKNVQMHRVPVNKRTW